MSEIQPSEIAKIAHDTRNTAQAAQATLETAQEMAEAANTGPTNAELKKAFDDHAALDKAFQDSQADVNAATLKSLASLHERFKDLGTKEDLANLQTMIKNISIGFGVIKFSWNNAGKIGGFVVLVAAVIAFFKVGLAAAVAILLGK